MTGKGRVYREKDLDRTGSSGWKGGYVSGERNFTFFTSRA